MPVITKGKLTIDHTDEGRGPPVILVHSSASSNRQWRGMSEFLTDGYRVLAPNLYGYGETTPWPTTAAQSFYAQAQIVLALAEDLGPVHLVGHSFGGSVAMMAARLLGERVASLTLLEPNPFSLLAQEGRDDAYLEAKTLRDHVQCFGALGDWTRVAERFADYWLGDGAWAAMPERRREAFALAIRPNLHEWAAIDEPTTVSQWSELRMPVLVVSDPATRRPIREIVELLEHQCKSWTFRKIASGGHMAPLTHPGAIGPIVREFLDATR